MQTSQSEDLTAVFVLFIVCSGEIAEAVMLHQEQNNSSLCPYIFLSKKGIMIIHMVIHMIIVTSGLNSLSDLDI